MQDMRALVTERSVIRMYVREEKVDLPYQSIGLLLEGFIKSHGVQEELITSPAVLLPSHGNQNTQSIGIAAGKAASFSHQGSWYQVETRARVIIFDIVAFEADIALQGRPSHLALPSGNSIDRPLSRERGGLMSWPEHVFKAREQLAIPKETEQQAMSLSAKAMQLSIFGSMVEMPWHRRSLSRISPTEPSHSMSSPRVPLYWGHLVSARSEGSVTMKKNLEVRKLKCKMPPQPPRRGGEMKEDRLADYSSDESGPEDEHIIRIDSPSVLSFNQAP